MKIKNVSPASLHIRRFAVTVSFRQTPCSTTAIPWAGIYFYYADASARTEIVILNMTSAEIRPPAGPSSIHGQLLVRSLISHICGDVAGR